MDEHGNRSDEQASQQQSRAPEQRRSRQRDMEEEFSTTYFPAETEAIPHITGSTQLVLLLHGKVQESKKKRQQNLSVWKRKV